MKYIILLILIITLNIPAYGFSFKAYSMNSTPGDDYIDLGLYDSFGGYTGYDINNPRNFIRKLPDFIPGSSTLGDFAGEYPVTNFIQGKKPDGTSGTYKIAIYGQRLAIYGIKGVMKEQSNTTGDGVFYINGITDIGQISYIQLDYTPNKPVVITRIATSTDLIADITTAQKLNLLGDAKFVAEITKEINEIEAERLKVDPSHGSGDDGLTPVQKAKKEYTELLKEITEKYNKPETDEFIKQEAYIVLKEDLEYIISHIQ